MRKPGEKPAIADTARARIQKFHEELAKLESKWGVEISGNDSLGISYVDIEREDDWDKAAEWDATREPDGTLTFETFEWWGK